MSYIEAVYQHYAQFWPQGVQGRAAELGPGDNCGAAVLLRARHAHSVDLVDRFYAERNPTTQSAIYRLLMARHPEAAALCSNMQSPGEQDFEGVTWHTGEKAAAEVFFSQRPETYAFITSCAVFEHLYDPVEALRHMAAALKPGGSMAHIIDLRDHGMFSSAGYPELEWLTIPDRVWPLMTKGHGRPNRVSLEEYRRVCQDLGLRTTFQITSVAGSGPLPTPVPDAQFRLDDYPSARDEVAKVRGRLARSLVGRSDESLAVTGVILHAIKPDRAR